LAKAKAEGAPPPEAAPPPAKQSVMEGRGKRVSKAYTKDVEDIVDKLFDLSDVDTSGVIDFGEFLVHHRNIMGVSDFAGAQENNAKLEMRFREYDKDNSLSLDREEFRMYMDSVLSILGKRKFVEICQALYEETIERQAETKKAYDPCLSERLVEKARGATRFLPDIEQFALQLIEKRADINFRDPTGSSTLLYSVDKSDESFVKHLLMHRANPALHNKEFDCPAFRASRTRSMDNLRLLLIPDSEVSGNANTVKGSQELVRNMANLTGADVTAALKKGADLNFRDQNGWTPLTAAVFWGKNDCLEALLRTQTTFAQVKLRMDMCNARGRAAIHIASRKGRTDMMVPLIKARSPVDLQDAEGWTALHHAVFNSMEDCVSLLLENSASLQVQGKAGFTPVMLSKTPECVGKLSERVQKKLDVPENMSFAKAMSPLLKDESLTVFKKLEAFLDLPSVYHVPVNLRLYEQCFDCRHGPNKVRLHKLWESLAMPLVLRLASQDTDLGPVPENGAADANMDRKAEVDDRMKEQMSFLRQWFIDTRGPRKGSNWKYDNREAYGEEMQKVLREEMAKFRVLFEQCFERMQRQPGGQDLVNRPCSEVMEGALYTQLQAHPMLPWLQRLDPTEAFEALRCVGAADMGGDDALSVLSFVDLLFTNTDFDNGKHFWKNVYRLWLASYAKLANLDFQKRLGGLVNRFAEANEKQDVTITFQGCEPKSYERIKAKEKTLGESTHENYEGRTMAAQVLDVVRCSIIVSSPLMACRLIDEVFQPLRLSRDKIEVMRIENRFSAAANTEELMGDRNIELTVMMEPGVRATACGRKDHSLHLKIIGEVQIVLEDFLNVRERRILLTKAARGEYDWPDEPFEEDDKGLVPAEDDWR